MSDEIKLGDLVKVEDTNSVFQVAGFTKGRDFIPDGWLIDHSGFSVNPGMCELYKGATSCITNEREG